MAVSPVIPEHGDLCIPVIPAPGDLCVTRHSRESGNPRPPAAAGDHRGARPSSTYLVGVPFVEAPFARPFLAMSAAAPAETRGPAGVRTRSRTSRSGRCHHRLRHASSTSVRSVSDGERCPYCARTYDAAIRCAASSGTSMTLLSQPLRSCSRLRCISRVSAAAYSNGVSAGRRLRPNSPPRNTIRR